MIDSGLRVADVQIIWQPGEVDPDDYARLVVAIGDLVRAFGGLGVSVRTASNLAVSIQSSKDTRRNRR